MASNIEELKRRAGEEAAAAVEPGMILGLGSGSTATEAIRAIGERLQTGRLHNIIGVPSSEATARLAQACQIPLATLSEQPELDLTIDGADEIDPGLNLIKGLGGALLREKVIAQASRRMIVVADHRKLVDHLGSRAPVPVEVIPFAEKPLTRFLEALGARPVLRIAGDRPFITDEGNIILDCHFGPIADAWRLAAEIRSRPGVVEHGLFLGMATEAIVAMPDGISRRTRS